MIVDDNTVIGHILVEYLDGSTEVLEHTVNAEFKVYEGIYRLVDPNHRTITIPTTAVRKTTSKFVDNFDEIEAAAMAQAREKRRHPRA